jgi:hypothetical protein
MRGWSTNELDEMLSRQEWGPKTSYYEAKAEAEALYNEGVLTRPRFITIVQALYDHYFLKLIRPLNLKPGLPMAHARTASGHSFWDAQTRWTKRFNARRSV